jgi:Tfp pilus assembly protein PilX
MRHHNTFSSRIARRTRRQRQHGVALVTTLLLLLLLTAVSLTMVLSVSSDMLINGYYAGYRSSFYAADSGVNMARQDIIARVLAAAPATFAPGVSPIPAGTDTTVLLAVTGDYNGSTQVNSAGSWPETFQIVNTAANPTTLTLVKCTVGGGLTVAGVKPTCAVPTFNAANPITSWSYLYNYTVSVVGHSQGSEVATVTDTGSLGFTANVTPAGPQTLNFAAFGTFIDQYPPCSAPFVPGTLTGQFFTNGAWNFGDSGQYIFQNSTGQANGQASYWHGNGACDNVAGPSDTNGTTVAPSFNGGFSLGAAPLPLPTDSFNQEQAVLDGKGLAAGQPSNATLNAGLKNPSGLKVPSNGVYLPYSTNAGGQNIFNGGGIYVQGDASVKLSPSGSAGEIYTITQGGTVTTVTVDNAAQTTTMISGGVTTVITGVPVMFDQTTGAFVEDATMLYVNGNITALSGPGENQTAVNNGIALTITAAQNVTITGDIRYAAEPVTTANNQIAGYPADSLIPANDHGQVLGVFTTNGDIQMDNKQADGNLWIDASIAMVSQGGSGGWINVGAHINNLNLLGGRIANQAKSGNTTTRNIFFDQRFASGGFAPPWFPSTTVVNGTLSSASFVQPTVQHVQWLNKTSYQ